MRTLRYVENPEANEHINLIVKLLAQGLSDQAVADHLMASCARNLASPNGSWTKADVLKIRTDFRLSSTYARRRRRRDRLIVACSIMFFAVYAVFLEKKDGAIEVKGRMISISECRRDIATLKSAERYGSEDKLRGVGLCGEATRDALAKYFWRKERRESLLRTMRNHVGSEMYNYVSGTEAGAISAARAAYDEEMNKLEALVK